MNLDLKDLVQSIYRDYTPLNDIDQQLLRRNGIDSFRQLVQKKCETLTECEQKRISDELFGWGPLATLLERDDIYDIMIQGSTAVYYEGPMGLQQHSDCFLSERSFQNFIERLMKESGLLINQKDPFGNGAVGAFRVHLMTPPISKQTCVTLRRHRESTFRLEELENSGFLNCEQKNFLDEILQDHSNFLIVGPTGSGKTTFLNSLIAHIPPSQRVIVIEDTDEIAIANPLSCKLIAREVCPTTLNKVTMEDLVKQSLRMRPDRLVIGEVRGQEAKDLLQALATGHSGSMGTLHAHSAKQALLRLEMLIQMGAPQWSLHSIRQLIQMSLHYLLVLKEDRLNKGIKEIHKITSHESFGLLLEKIF